MEAFKQVVSVLAFLSLGFVATEAYLTLNKLWKRKHDRAVSESISVLAKIVGLIPLVVFSLDNLFKEQWRALIETMIWTFATTAQLLIGMGLWVAATRRRTLWALLKNAVGKESSEIGDLARAFVRPPAAKQLLKVLGQLALIDDHLDDRERAMLETFAKSWGLTFSLDLAEKPAVASSRLVQLHQSVRAYLDTSPPAAQVAQLTDVLRAMVGADEKVTAEEKLALAELEGMLGRYGGAEAPILYYAAVVPQSREQQEAMASMLAGLEKRAVPGGVAFLAGPFFSEGFAAAVSAQQRALNFFSVVIQSDEIESVAQRSSS